MNRSCRSASRVSYLMKTASGPSPPAAVGRLVPLKEGEKGWLSEGEFGDPSSKDPFPFLLNLNLNRTSYFEFTSSTSPSTSPLIVTLVSPGSVTWRVSFLSPGFVTWPGDTDVTWDTSLVGVVWRYLFARRLPLSVSNPPRRTLSAPMLSNFLRPLATLLLVRVVSFCNFSQPG